MNKKHFSEIENDKEKEFTIDKLSKKVVLYEQKMKDEIDQIKQNYEKKIELYENQIKVILDEKFELEQTI